MKPKNKEIGERWCGGGDDDDDDDDDVDLLHDRFVPQTCVEEMNEERQIFVHDPSCNCIQCTGHVIRSLLEHYHLIYQGG